MEQRRSSQSFKRKELVGKLNPVVSRAFKAAADTAKLRGNPYVELVHFIEQLVLSDRSDVQMIIADAGVDASRITADMTRAVDKLPYGATSIEEFSDHIFHAIQEAWNLATLEFGVEEVRSAYILLACLKTPVLEGLLSKISGEFDKIDADAVIARFADVDGGLARRRRRADGAPPPRRRRAGSGRGFGAGEIRHRPDPARARRQDRSGRRPRSGDPADRRYPDAAPAEQSDPDRRGRGRQDCGRRGLCLAYRRGRRAADPAERQRAHARRRVDAGGRQREGRIRKTAEGGHR